jgi:DNA-binding transcriptional LysR family regulator
VRLRSFDAICRMVERGVGIGVIPEAAARRCQRSMALHKVVLSDAWALRRLCLCVRRYAELSAYSRLLVDELQAAP